MLDDQHYFKFEFSSVHNKSKNMNYYVYAKDIDDLKSFMLQHRFSNVPSEAVTIVDRETVTKNYECKHILEPYKFKSNLSDEIITVITSWDFINDAVDRLVDQLNQTMLFGEAIMRRDVTIFQVIGDIVNGLGCSRVIDFELCEYAPDDEFGEDSYRNIDLLYKMQKEYMKKVGHPTEDTESWLTYEMLFDAMDDDEDGVLPITIECYASNFNEMMMDVFV